MAGRQFRPGSPKYSSGGRLSAGRIAWGKVKIAEAIVYQLRPEDNDDENFVVEAGNSISLHIRTPGSRYPCRLNLTGCTEEELATLKTVIDMAFELAKPTTKLRDRIAQDAYDNGDDSFERVYRQLPLLVVRPRGESPYPDRVRVGPESAPGGDGAGGSDRPGDDVAQLEPGPVGAQDDCPPPDNDPLLGDVGGA